MFDASLYAPVTLSIVFILVLIKTLSLNSSSDRIQPESKSGSLVLCFLIAGFFTIFYGFRPITHALGDTKNYAIMYMESQYVQSDFIDSITSTQEPIWKLLMSFMATSGYDVHSWFLVICAISFICVIWAFRNIMPNYTYLCFLLYISQFFFFSNYTNGIRNNLSISIILLAISFITNSNGKNNIIVCIILSLLAYSIHTSSIILMVSMVLSKFVIKNTKGAIACWLTAIIISLMFGQSASQYFALISHNETAIGYVEAMDDSIYSSQFSSTGFRWDFLLYSGIPIFIGWYATIRHKIEDAHFQLIFNTYVLTNAIWIIFMYAAFTNRFAALSWSISPLIFCYAFTQFEIWNFKSARYLSMLLWFQIAFSAYICL